MPDKTETERPGSEIYAEILRKSPARYRWWLQEIEDAIAYMRIIEDEVIDTRSRNVRESREMQSRLDNAMAVISALKARITELEETNSLLQLSMSGIQ